MALLARAAISPSPRGPLDRGAFLARWGRRIQGRRKNVEAARTGTLTAEAREVARNPKLATYTTEVRDEAGELVALAHGTIHRKDTATPSAETK